MKTDYPWLKGCWKWQHGDKPLTREEFIKEHYPQYVQSYRSPTGIRTYRSKATGRMIVQSSTKGSYQAQVTKRNNIIDESYKQYLATFQSCMEMQAPLSNCHPSNPEPLKVIHNENNDSSACS